MAALAFRLRQRRGRPERGRVPDLLVRLRPGAGDPVWQVAPGTPFEALPPHWSCPNCAAEQPSSWCSTMTELRSPRPLRRTRRRASRPPSARIWPTRMAGPAVPEPGAARRGRGLPPLGGRVAGRARHALVREPRAAAGRGRVDAAARWARERIVRCPAGRLRFIGATTRTSANTMPARSSRRRRSSRTTRRRAPWRPPRSERSSTPPTRGARGAGADLRPRRSADRRRPRRGGAAPRSPSAISCAAVAAAAMRSRVSSSCAPLGRARACGSAAALERPRPPALLPGAAPAEAAALGRGSSPSAAAPRPRPAQRPCARGGAAGESRPPRDARVVARRPCRRRSGAFSSTGRARSRRRRPRPSARRAPPSRGARAAAGERGRDASAGWPSADALAQWRAGTSSAARRPPSSPDRRGRVRRAGATRRRRCRRARWPRLAARRARPGPQRRGVAARHGDDAWCRRSRRRSTGPALREAPHWGGRPVETGALARQQPSARGRADRARGRGVARAPRRAAGRAGRGAGAPARGRRDAAAGRAWPRAPASAWGGGDGARAAGAPRAAARRPHRRLPHRRAHGVELPPAGRLSAAAARGAATRPRWSRARALARASLDPCVGVRYEVARHA